MPQGPETADRLGVVHQTMPLVEEFSWSPGHSDSRAPHLERIVDRVIRSLRAYHIENRAYLLLISVPTLAVPARGRSGSTHNFVFFCEPPRCWVMLSKLSE